MNETQPATPIDSVQAYLANELRRHRLSQGLTQEQLSERVNYSTGLISMVETGRRLPNRDFTTRCDEALKADGALSRLWPLVNREFYPNWFRSFVEFEAEATSIMEFHLQAMPGLLQTEAYARAVLRGMWPPNSDDDTNRLLAARMDRQRILERKKPPLLWIVLDEAVLYRPVGGPEVMAAQLAHLMKMAERPNIQLQVLTYELGACAPMDGAFVVLEMPDGESIGYIEGAGGGQLLTQPAQVADCERRFGALRSRALSPEASIKLIERTMKEGHGHRRSAVVEE